MSCDHELANEWVRCSGRKASYITIGHVRYINIQAWLRGFRVKIANFSSFFCLSIPTGDLDTKKTTPNIDVRPESLGPMLEYWYIERGLFTLFREDGKEMYKDL